MLIPYSSRNHLLGNVVVNTSLQNLKVQMIRDFVYNNDINDLKFPTHYPNSSFIWYVSPHIAQHWLFGLLTEPVGDPWTIA